MIEHDTSLDLSQGSLLDSYYARYCRDPQSVSANWRAFFSSLATEVDGKQTTADIRDGQGRGEQGGDYRARAYIEAVRARGHYLADLDPLGRRQRHYGADLDPTCYGLDASDDSHLYDVGGFFGKSQLSARALVALVQQAYGGTLALDYTHIDDSAQRSWLQGCMEGVETSADAGEALSKEDARLALEKLTEGELFEHFLQRHYPGSKRFSLEGAESLLPMLEFTARSACAVGVQEIVLGMAHRGRLNVLAHILHKPFEALFYQFDMDAETSASIEGSGDVKYHIGASADRRFGESLMHVSLSSNPSHLEVINPVVLGKVRAKQYQRGSFGKPSRQGVMGVLVHGDAAFAGQGIVSETLDLSDLRGYRTGGTIHIIINNQIGFTTNSNDARSSAYCSDHAKSIQAPIFHVNGDDPQQVVRVARMAVAYRQKFQRDVVIDLFCYRRHGHSEVDDPSFTQPLMYQSIANLPTTRTLFAKRLVAQGHISEKEDKELCARLHGRLREALSSKRSRQPPPSDWLEGHWRGREQTDKYYNEDEDSLDSKTLKNLAATLFAYPRSFAIHPKLKTLYSKRLEAVKTGKAIDWASGELLAFASLLHQSVGVRLSGQDSARGTFSQRHGVLIDQKSGESFMPLQGINDKVVCEIINSPLSEAGVLGYEYGFSLSEPQVLTLWEAQFGDFANGAQVIIDQFVAGAESKWLRMSGLVILLPHGYEGQGPDHSSARPERYLQLCAQSNMVVANCTTPANYYHLLRRQMRRPFRKPLIVFTPKSLLRHPLCVSPLEDFTAQEGFRRVLPDPLSGQLQDVRRVICCSGHVYYDLLEERKKQGITDMALLRIEQFYPFPALDLEGLLRQYAGAEIVWCQEEPRNMGAWAFVRGRLAGLKSARAINKPIVCVARPPSAVTATGLHVRHVMEGKELLAQVFADTLVDRDTQWRQGGSQDSRGGIKKKEVVT